MGQGYSMAALSATSATINVPELSDLILVNTLAPARFMKSVQARNQQGYVFVKAVMKPYSSFQIEQYIKQILHERDVLAQIPNALGHQQIVEVSSSGFLLRQFIHFSLYDRISTRPFLEDIEKKWLAFQLLHAVRDCHAENIYHGDIKTENVLVTSSNWLYLSDFSSAFKPTTLPEDNPADFFFYFDTSGRRTCFIAPERFTDGSIDETGLELNWAMDIFSVGCVIAEMFLESPIFSLAQIFRYRSGEYSPEHTQLNKIEDEEVRAMILNMIDLDPEKRYSAEQHLTFYRGKIFPEYFYSFFHQYMLDMTEISTLRHPFSLDAATLTEADIKIDRIYQDFEKFSFFLGYGSNLTLQSIIGKRGLEWLQNKKHKQSKVLYADPSLHDGTLLFLALVVANMRSATKAASKLKACDLLMAFATRLPDEAKLDRVLPYIVSLLDDKSDAVKINALYATTSILEMIEVVAPINAYIFPEYIFPKLREFILGGEEEDASSLVRSAYASCIASLASSADKVLHLVQAIRADGRMPALSENEWAPEKSYYGLYDVARAELVPHFEEATKSLITDPEPSVRRALLGSIAQLCVFFGSTKSADIILTHLNTYLNEKDWLLRCAFLEALVGIAVYVGSVSLETFILPLMVGSLVDPELFVVEKVFRSLSRMASLGLIGKSVTWDLISIAARFTVHPSSWVRESAVQFIVASTTYTDMVDNVCIILPMIQPYFRTATLGITEVAILDNLKKPLSKPVFEKAFEWASRKPDSLFWTFASRDGAFLLPGIDFSSNTGSTGKKLSLRIPPSQRDKDDQTNLETLKNLGMTVEDEFKLLALREYIFRASRRKADVSTDEKLTTLNNIVRLTQIGVTPQTIFFDAEKPIRTKDDMNIEINNDAGREGKHTLADALLDASTNLDDLGPQRIGEIDQARGEMVGRPSNPVSIPNASQTSQPANGQVHVQTDGQFQNASAIPRSLITNGKLSPLSMGASPRYGPSLELRHHNSAINLLNRRDGSKADAETATSSETAFGRMDPGSQRLIVAGPSKLAPSDSARSRSKFPLNRTVPVQNYQANHSYAGNDPNVLRLLDSHFMENYAIDEFDFGIKRPSIEGNTPIRKATENMATGGVGVAPEVATFHTELWRPTGQLLTQFAEHNAAINRVVVAPDHTFFVTASDDSTCKVWDTTRLEKNITPRSRCTHRHAPGSKVKALCFIEDSHTFVSAADDGSINAVKIEIKTVENGDTTRYGKPVLVRDYQLSESIPRDIPEKEKGETRRTNEHAVWLHHYRTPTTQSILLIATNRSRILMIDMKNMDVIRSMQNPAFHGVPTTFCVDRKHQWLLLGTSHGILDLWDLRFKINSRSIGLPTDARIDRVVIHPSKGHGRWVMVSAGGEISVWDIEKLQCQEVFRPYDFISPAQSRSYDAWEPDEKDTTKILERFAKDLDVDDTLLEPDLYLSGDASSVPLTPTKSDKQPANKKVATTSTSRPRNNPITTILPVTDFINSSNQPTDSEKSSILFSAGVDKTLRYWDIAHPELSFIVSGPPLQSEDAATVKVKYDLSHPLSLNMGAQITLISERIGDQPRYRDREATGPGSARSTPRKGPSRVPSTATVTTPPRSNTPTAVSRPSPSKGTGASGKPTRNSLISTTQQQLLKTHIDPIMDIAILRKPYGCVVSVDRGGCVYVFH